MVSYKYCVVPQCKNTTVRSPEKKFFYLPKDEGLRKTWCIAMKQDMVTCSTVRSVCEDHFDLKADVRNYLQCELMGGTMLLNKDAVPHKFHCQGRGPRPRTTGTRRRRLATINEILKNNSSSCTSDPVKSPNGGCELPNDYFEWDTISTTFIKKEVKEEEEEVFEPHINSEYSLTDEKAIQVHLKPHFRSRGSSAGPVMRSRASSPILMKRKRGGIGFLRKRKKKCVHRATSPIQFSKINQESEVISFQIGDLSGESKCIFPDTWKAEHLKDKPQHKHQDRKFIRAASV